MKEWNFITTSCYYNFLLKWKMINYIFFEHFLSFTMGFKFETINLGTDSSTGIWSTKTPKWNLILCEISFDFSTLLLTKQQIKNIFHFFHSSLLSLNFFQLRAHVDKCSRRMIVGLSWAEGFSSLNFWFFSTESLSFFLKI